MVDDRVSTQDVARQLALHSRVTELFRRLPMLSGFYVGPDLNVMELAVFTWPGWVLGPELADEIRDALEELIFDDTHSTADMLRGRTFARAIH